MATSSIIEFLSLKSKPITIENFVLALGRFIPRPTDLSLILDTADIAFIKTNFDSITPDQAANLLKPKAYFEGLYATLFKVGDRSFISENELVPIEENFTRLNIEVFLLLYRITNRPNALAFQSNLSEETLNYIILKKIDELISVLSLDPFKFSSFDEKSFGALQNFFATYNGKINGLYKAYSVPRATNILTGNKDWYWEATKGGKISGECGDSAIKKVIYPQLFKRESSFKYPFDDEQEFNPPLDFDKITDLPIRNLTLNDSPSFLNRWANSYSRGWFPKEIPIINLVYGNFLLEFINNSYKITTKREEFDYRKTKELLEKHVQELLNTKITFTVGVTDYSDPLSRTEETVTLTYQKYVAKLLLDDFRENIWNNFALQFSGLDCDDIQKLGGNESNKEKAFEKAEQGVELPTLGTPAETDEDKPTDEDIEQREKFLKQCMLMTRLDDLANENITRIAASKNKDLKIHKKNGAFAPYQNRFYMIEDTLYTDGDQSSTVNKLVIPNGNSIREFLDIRPSTHAYLVPKLRFYKVYTGDDGKLKEFPFHFRNFTDSNRVNKLSDVDFDRGGDYGIKEFNFSFDGTNPATAKNDIKANLSLYFQTFSDFIDRKFTDSSGEKHAFVDLLLLPSGKKKEGSGAPAIFQFDAKHYRIRVDVGWEIDSTRVSDLEQSIGVSGANNLRSSIQLMNKSFYLNMVDHTMDFRDDGSVQIDVEYRAYIESALKGTSLDALASPESREALKLVRADYEAVLSKNRCSAKELNEIRLQLEQIEDLFKKQAYQSIMKRLIKNDSIRYKKVKAGGEQKSFLRRGYFTEKIIFGSDNEQPSNQISEASERVETFTTDESGFNDLKLSDNFLSINFFYLGDLLYAILDTLYNEDGTYIEGFEKFKFVFGSFQYEDLTDASSDAKVINLANIPVSCELFFEWFTDNIIKSERNSYPIMYFIRDLCKFLISEILSESCFKRSFDKTLQFKTMNFMGLSKNEKKDPLGSLYDYSNNDPDVIKDQLTLDVGQKYKAGQLPLANDLNGSNNITDFYNYVTIYVDTPRQKTNKDKTTTRSQDEADGIMHYQIGRDRGILKKIKFSKSDMQYVREARFFRHGHDGLMQLSAVYKVSLDMVGNTLYYPGMEIFIDPLGLVGANSEADPREKRSVANRLGFGGYHLVTSVNSSIGPGKFTTKVDALFSYSGDGDPSSAVVGRKIDTKKDGGTNKIDEAPDNRPQSYKDYCAAIKNKVITQAVRINAGQNAYEPIDYQSAENTFVTTEGREERAQAYEDSVSGGTTGMTDEERDILIDAGALGNNSTETPLETLLRQAEEEDE